MMRMMRFRDLEYFIAVAEHGSFSRAAEICGVSQPTLSAQIKRIEGLLGVDLIDRQVGGAALTVAGTEVLSSAREIMDTFYQVEQPAAGDGSLLGRPLHFGILPTVAPYAVGPLLEAFDGLNDGNDIDFVEDRTSDLETAVSAGDLDFAVTATPPRAANLVAFPLWNESLMAASAEPLPDEIAMEDIARPILLMKDGHCFREVVSEAIRRAAARGGAPIVRHIQPSSFATLLHLVAAGRGDTLLPAPFVARSPGLLAGLHVARLLPADEGRMVQLVVRRGREGYRDVARIVAAARAAAPSNDVGAVPPPSPIVASAHASAL